MIEADMYPLFKEYLHRTTDLWIQEQPLIPATFHPDFMAFKDGHVIVYELKLRDAKNVIIQANRAILYCDHAYAVLPREKVHLGIKYQNLILKHTGLMSLDMQTGNIKVHIDPQTRTHHQTIPLLRKGMIELMIRETINRHFEGNRHDKETTS